MLNITGNKDYVIDECDLLCVGGPVYVGHIESNVLKAISTLPDSKKYGRYVVPVVTYGGMHSSIGLEEAGEALAKSGRTVIAGMKIASFHTLSKTLSRQINIDRPGQEEENVISQLADRISEIIKSGSEPEGVEASFSYAPEKQREMCKKLSNKSYRTNKSKSGY